MSRNKYRPHPPDHRPAQCPVAVMTAVGPDSITVAMPESSRTCYGSPQIRAFLDKCHEHSAILYAPGAEWRKLRTLLATLGIPESAFARRNQGGYYIDRPDRAEPVAFEYPDLPPVYFCKPLNTLSAGNRAAEVFGFLAFARSQGVYPDAPHAMAFELWKTTWPTFAPDGFTPWYYADSQHPNRPTVEAYRALPLFGRDQAPQPGLYGHATFYDKVAAYPSVMADGGGFPWQLRKIDRLPRAGEVGISRVSVHRVPDVLWQPLPYGPGVIPNSRGGWITEPLPDVWLSNRELLLAQECGVELDAREVCIGQYYEHRMFAAWFDLYQEAKRLPFGADLAKWLFTRLWGQLSTRDDLLPVAVEITARLREQVYREALGRPEVGAVYVEVDGIIATGTPPQPQGTGPGDWRVKPDSGPVDADSFVLGESTHAYYRDGDGKRRYHAERQHGDWHEFCEQLGVEKFGDVWRNWKPPVMAPVG
jgi:hypothetical protein